MTCLQAPGKLLSRAQGRTARSTPIPIEVPPTFIAEVNACTYNGTCMVDATGADCFAQVSGSTWQLGYTGDAMGSATFNLLRGATANPDGSFTAASGASYWLDPIRGAAVASPK